MEHLGNGGGKGCSPMGLLDLWLTDTSAMALWFLAAVLQLVANLLLTQQEFTANYTVQVIADFAWLIAAIAHAVALRAIAVGLQAWVHAGLLIGASCFVVSAFLPQPPGSPVVFYWVFVGRLFFFVCATTVSRTSPMRKVRLGAVGFLSGAGVTCINALCSLYYPEAPYATVRSLAAGAFLTVGGFTWTTVVAERELPKEEGFVGL